MNFFFPNTIKVLLVRLFGNNFQSVIANIHDSKKITSSHALINIVKPYPLKRHLLSWNNSSRLYDCQRIKGPQNTGAIHQPVITKSNYVKNMNTTEGIQGTRIVLSRIFKFNRSSQSLVF